MFTNFPIFQTDKLFAAGWLAYGHAFAADGENDQAMATYFTASRLLKGCHLPLLYIGLQYGSTNNPLLAEKFFQEAIAMAPDDPFVLAEMGAVYTQMGKWEPALSHLQQVSYFSITIFPTGVLTYQAFLSIIMASVMSSP